MHRLAHVVLFYVAVASTQFVRLPSAAAQEGTATDARDQGAAQSTTAPYAGPSIEAAAPSPAVVDPKANFKETGRFGVIGALTEDMWKGGVVFEHEHWETQALAHAGIYSKGNRDVHVIFKVGARMALGTLNYLAFGAEGQAHPGSLQDHHRDNKSFQLGPYISLQRYFAATPVMLNLWVNPVLFDRNYEFNEAGKPHAHNGVHFFQTGGFGIAYLF